MSAELNDSGEGEIFELARKARNWEQQYFLPVKPQPILTKRTPTLNQKPQTRASKGSQTESDAIPFSNPEIRYVNSVPPTSDTCDACNRDNNLPEYSGICLRCGRDSEPPRYFYTPPDCCFRCHRLLNWDSLNEIAVERRVSICENCSRSLEIRRN